MPLREVIRLAHARIDVEERTGFLYLVESGQLIDLDDFAAYTGAIERVIRRTGIVRAVIDARAEVGDPPEQVREAMWSWLLAPDRGFSIVAFVLPSEMAVARVNMTALARRAPLRAFDTVHAAQRWLVRGQRTSTFSSLPAVTVPSEPSDPLAEDQSAVRDVPQSERVRRDEPTGRTASERPVARAGRLE